MAFSYIDSEGDEVVLSDEDDYKDALLYQQQKKEAAPKLELHFREEGKLQDLLRQSFAQEMLRKSQA